MRAICIFFLILQLILTLAQANLFYCGDWDCKEPISLGKTLQLYSARTNQHISFQRNDDIKILSKPVDKDNKDGDWVAECRGRVGLVPQSMVREHKIMKLEHKYKFPLDDLPILKERLEDPEDEVVESPQQQDEEQQPPVEDEPQEKKNVSDDLNALGEEIERAKSQHQNNDQHDHEHDHEHENTSENSVEVESQPPLKPTTTSLPVENEDSNETESKPSEPVESPQEAPKTAAEETVVDSSSSSTESPSQQSEFESVPKSEDSSSVESDLNAKVQEEPEKEQVVTIVQETSSSSSSSSSSVSSSDQVQSQNVESPPPSQPVENELNPEVIPNAAQEQETQQGVKEEGKSDSSSISIDDKKENEQEPPSQQKPEIILEEAFPFEPERENEVEPEEEEEDNKDLREEDLQNQNSPEKTNINNANNNDQEKESEQQESPNEQAQAQQPIEPSVNEPEVKVNANPQAAEPEPEVKPEEVEPSGIFSALNTFSTKIMSNLLPEDLQDDGNKVEDSKATEDEKPSGEAPWFNEPETANDDGAKPGRRRAWSSLEPKLKEPTGSEELDDNSRAKREVDEAPANSNAESEKQDQAPSSEAKAEAENSPEATTTESLESEISPQQQQVPHLEEVQAVETPAPEVVVEEQKQDEESASIVNNETEANVEPQASDPPQDDANIIGDLPTDSDNNNDPKSEELNNQNSGEDSDKIQEAEPQTVTESTSEFNSINNKNNQSPPVEPESELPQIPGLPVDQSANIKLETAAASDNVKEPEIVIPEIPSPPAIQEPLAQPPPAEEVKDNNNNNNNEEQVPVVDSTTNLHEETSSPPSNDHGHQHASTEDHADHHGHDHDHDHHHHHHHHSHDFNTQNASSSSSIVTVIRHLSARLLSFLPEALQDSILDVNDVQIFSGIIALLLISVCVPYFFVESYLATRPLKKQVEELSNSLWKSKTAYEIQLEEFEGYKKKALAHDEKQKRIDQLENELLVANKLLSKQKEQIKLLQKELKVTSRAAANFESHMESTRQKKDEAIAERDSLLQNIRELQGALKTNVAELEDSQAEARFMTEQLEQATHEKETLSKLLKKSETTLELAKTKTLNEAEARRQAEETVGAIRAELESVKEELASVKSICEQYEKTASELSEEVTSKENELLALKETLGEDSPLIEIAEAKARSATAEEEANTLRKRVESMSIEISSLSRNYDETKSELIKVKVDKESAENRLEVLESWFKKQEEELRATVEKYETERNIRGKDESELIKLIHEKEDEIKQLQATVEALKTEIEEIKIANRNEIRNLEARNGDNFLQMCQAERKINEARKEAELLRQKLAAVARQGEDTGAGDVPLYSSLPPDMQPLPPLPDDLPMSMNMPSYFGMGELLDPLPPLPLGAAENMGNINRPPPLGRISTTPPYSYGDDGPASPIQPPHGINDHNYSNYSSRSNSPLDHMRPGSRDNWMNDHDNRSDNRDNRNQQHHHLRNNQNNNSRHRGPLPNSTSSPIPHPHGINL